MPMMTLTRCGVVAVLALGSGLEASDSGARKAPNIGVEGTKPFAIPKGSASDYGFAEAKPLPRPMDAEAFWRILGEQRATVKLATAMVVYRGVPVRMSAAPGDKAVPAVDVDESTLLRVDEQAFFPEAYSVDGVLLERLRTEIFAGVREPSNKFSGFHADYLLKWAGLMAETEVQICFSCAQIRIKNVAGTISGDLAGPQAAVLKELLQEYGKPGKAPFGIGVETSSKN